MNYYSFVSTSGNLAYKESPTYEAPNYLYLLTRMAGASPEPIITATTPEIAGAIISEVHQNTITVTFTDEEFELLEAYAAEENIEPLSAAIPAMLHELLRLHDAWWDSQLEQRPPELLKEAEAALEEYEASKTEALDSDS